MTSSGHPYPEIVKTIPHVASEVDDLEHEIQEQAIWVGWASKRLSRNDDSQKLINEAVCKILVGFPRASGT